MKKLILITLLLTHFSLNAQQKGYQLGSKIEDFQLVNVSGKKTSLADYSGVKGFIIAFTCNTCPVAQAYEGRLIDLDKKYKSQGYPVIAINPNDPAVQNGEALEDMKKRSESSGYTFPYLYDPGNLVAKAFYPTKTPHIFIVHHDKGDLVVKYIGAIDDSQDGTPEHKYVENALADLMQGKNPSVPATKAVGCAVKWKKDVAMLK